MLCEEEESEYAAVENEAEHRNLRERVKTGMRARAIHNDAGLHWIPKKKTSFSAFEEFQVCNRDIKANVGCIEEA